MSLSNQTILASFNAGKMDGARNFPYYTCAGCDPKFLELLAQQPIENRGAVLMDLAREWDKGYMSERAKQLVAHPEAETIN